MTPADALNRLPELLEYLGEPTDHFVGECQTIMGQWKRLKGLCGERDDHAADLIKNLRPHLADMRNRAATALRQLDACLAADSAQLSANR